MKNKFNKGNLRQLLKKRGILQDTLIAAINTYEYNQICSLKSKNRFFLYQKDRFFSKQNYTIFNWF